MNDINSTTNPPHFKYNPNAYERSGLFNTEDGICDCCGKKTNMWVDFMYTAEDVECICANCIADGSAAEKYNGGFVDFSENGVVDQNKVDELMKRTTGYDSWQGERWKVCCADYCAYLGRIEDLDLDELGVSDSVFQECSDQEGYEITRSDLIEEDHRLCGYLFQCLHCGKYHIAVDCD